MGPTNATSLFSLSLIVEARELHFQTILNYHSDRWFNHHQSQALAKHIGVRANIHLGGQTEFCPNGEHNLFVMRPRQGEKNNNEPLQCLFLMVVD